MKIVMQNGKRNILDWSENAYKLGKRRLRQ
ncbi:hypothetical protein JOD02_000066 [Caldicoprobacter guelmensis]|nr:hypothetical protein [Caldicoprobacter guelmensis]